jgi:predicted Zn-dependent protease
MESAFRELSAEILTLLKGDEVLLLNFDGEDSDFVRFNRNAIRQAGHVHQRRLQLTLIDGRHQAAAAFQLCGQRAQDLEQARAVLDTLRQQLPFLPDDPYINYAGEAHDTVQRETGSFAPARDTVSGIIAAARGLDLVGLWSSGEMASGFANSLGQFNWYSRASFNLDWSFYHQGDKAVKQDYAGFEWQQEVFEEKIARARETLPLLAGPPRSIAPGRYRVFLAPAALYELTTLLGWGGFDLKSHRTAQTPLLRMIRAGVTLHPAVNLSEHHAAGLAPPFTRAGFIKPQCVDLIRDGVYHDCLADARSASEYATTVNCDLDYPQSLQIAAGELPAAEALRALDTGLYISNLWYCNYSDRSHCRITGMTRFACLWVENGRIVAPVNVMRFDETLYTILGSGLLALTREQEHLFDSSTYDRRSQDSALLPGALVEGFTLTL